MKVSDFLIEVLVENKIDKVFSYIGKNAHICDSIDKHTDIENIFCIHEQGAGFAAEGYARVTGKTGVTTVTSGPGATNLVTSIADCYADSIPNLAIIGEVEISDCKQDRKIRQFGFQETDIVSIVQPITKYAVLIHDIHELKYEFEKALFIAQEGRKGPVLVGIPETLQYPLDYNPKNEKSFIGSEEHIAYLVEADIQQDAIDKTADMINAAARPVILVGGGVRLSNASSELLNLISKTNIPVVYSLMGKDVVSSSYEYNLGFIGNFGNRYSNFTVTNSDLILVLGSRLDNLQTGRNVQSFTKGAKLIQVDIDTNELGIRLNIDLEINADIKSFLVKLNKKTFDVKITHWQEKVLDYKREYPSEFGLKNEKKVGNQIISNIAKYSHSDDIICADVGEHQMLVAQSFHPKVGQRVLFSGGFGAMGFALPTAIGASVGTGSRSIVISGDGGFQMNIQELEMIKRRNLPLKIFIINNASLHMVKLRQDTYNEGNYVGTKKDYSVPDFKKIGEAYGIKSHTVSGIENINELIKSSLENDECELFDIQIEGDMTTVEPRLDFNREFEDMRPYLDKDELAKQMNV